MRIHGVEKAIILQPTKEEKKPRFLVYVFEVLERPTTVNEEIKE